MNQRERELWIECLRIAASLAVVILHVGSSVTGAVPVQTSAWQGLNFWCSVTRFGVPVFFMISGLLYLDPLKEVELGRLYKKNIGKLFAAHWFWMLFYGFWNVIVYWGNRGSAKEILKESIKTAVLSPPAHMWYLPALIGILMICPVLRLVTEKEDPKLLEYIIILCFVFGILRNTILLFEMPHQDMLSSVINSISPELTAGWAGIYFLGFYLYKYKLSQKKEYDLYFLGIFSVTAATVLNAGRALRMGTATNDFCNNLTLFSVLYAAAVFVFFMKYKWDRLPSGFILNISRCTLGIYLIHPCWIDIFEKLGITGISYNTWFMVPALGLLIFLMSWLSILILKRIPIAGKWIV